LQVEAARSLPFPQDFVHNPAPRRGTAVVAPVKSYYNRRQICDGRTEKVRAEVDLTIPGGSSVDQKDTDFMKVFIGILIGLLAFMILAIIGANAISGGESADIQKDPMVQAAIEKRIAPVGEVNTAEVKQVASSGGADGKSIYQSTCFACHGTGAAGAPKFGDSGAWGPRIGKGMDTLYKHAIHGFKGMPPKGGNGGLSDDEVKAAVKYIVDNSK
jgi:cytochrome c5